MAFLHREVRPDSLIRKALEAPKDLFQQKSYTLDLGTARDWQQVEQFREAENLLVAEITGTAQIKLDTLSNPAHDLTKVQAFRGLVKRVFIYNTAQSGKTLVLKAGVTIFEKSMRDIEADISSMQTDIANVKSDIADVKTAIQSVDSKQDDVLGSLVNIVTVSDNLLLSSDAQVDTTEDTPQKVKEFLIKIGGKYRIKFDFYNGTPGYGAGRIYINGVGVGTQRAAGTWTTFSEDLDVDVNDLLQLYIWDSPTTGHAYARNFRLYGDESHSIGVENTV